MFRIEKTNITSEQAEVLRKMVMQPFTHKFKEKHRFIALTLIETQKPCKPLLRQILAEALGKNKAFCPCITGDKPCPMRVRQLIQETARDMRTRLRAGGFVDYIPLWEEYELPVYRKNI